MASAGVRRGARHIARPATVGHRYGKGGPQHTRAAATAKHTEATGQGQSRFGMSMCAASGATVISIGVGPMSSPSACAGRGGTVSMRK